MSDHLVSCPIETEEQQETQAIAETMQSNAEGPSSLSCTRIALDLAWRSNDKDVLQWIRERWSTHAWFALTVRFDLFTVDKPMAERCYGTFDSYVSYKIRKLVGVKYRPILFMREYELGLDGNSYCHHIHAVIGIEKKARIDRLTQSLEMALMSAPKRRIDGVHLAELKTEADVDAAYSYMRKWKWNKNPFS